jgi:hypothetical protein
MGLIVLGSRLTIIDRWETPFRRPLLQADGTLPGVSHPLNQPYADGLTLIGFDRSAEQMPADGSLRIDLYWSVREPPSGPVQSTVYLVGPQGFLWSPENSYRPRGYHDPPPATTWRPGQYVVDSHEIEPLPGTPPGTYQVVLNVFDRDTLAPLSVLDQAGQPVAPQLTLGQVTLTAPREPVPWPERHRVDVPLGDVTLVSADFDRQQAAPGDTVYLTALWRDEGAVPGATDALVLALRSPEGRVLTDYVAPQTAVHQPGDICRSQHRLTLPATLESGSYVWTVGRAGDLDAPGHPIGELSVAAPPHVYAAPPLELALDRSLGGVATLLGASFDPTPAELTAGSRLTVTLVWRAEATPSVSYHVFLHLLDDRGRLVAQSDGVPVGWTRPTTGWLPGEVIVDRRILDIPPQAPPGGYLLAAGLYVPGGDRLVTPEGDDAVQLTSLTLAE